MEHIGGDARNAALASVRVQSKAGAPAATGEYRGQAKGDKDGVVVVVLRGLVPKYGVAVVLLRGERVCVFVLVLVP